MRAEQTPATIAPSAVPKGAQLGNSEVLREDSYKMVRKDAPDSREFRREPGHVPVIVVSSYDLVFRRLENSGCWAMLVVRESSLSCNRTNGN
jgi:hypothetical protein